MALTKESIALIQEKLPDLRTHSEHLAETYETYKTNLMKNTNYQAFVNGTEIGKELDNKFMSLCDIIKGISNEELKNLITTIDYFVLIQEELNK